MEFKKETPVGAYEIEKKQGEEVIYLNYLKASLVPDIAENGQIMSSVIDALSENPNIARIVFVQQRNYSYDPSQTLLLQEIARVYTFLIKQENILSQDKLVMFGNPTAAYSELSYLLGLLKQDPARCYLELKRRVLDNRNQQITSSYAINYTRFLERILLLLEGTKLIRGFLEQAENSGREFYKRIFRPEILPNFSFTRLMAKMPDGAELVDQYQITDEFETITVTILKQKNEGKYFYHILPSEYTLKDEHHVLVSLARNVLVEHRPKSEEFTDPEKTRSIFLNVARDLLSELSRSKGINLNYRELNKLSQILVRHTIGFGLVEVLLLDDKLQDIVLNAPIAQNPVFVRHAKYEECVTNIIPSYEDAESWAAKLRLQSGRPLDEANPILDTDLSFGKIRARVAAIKEPLSPSGLAYAIRRHRDDPWTLPLFIKNKMINSFAAGLLSFLVDGSRTLLVAGTRSSGKTSLLGSLLLEIMPRYRIIVVEDTLELPVDSLRKIGYDILRMKVRSALTEGTTEVAAAEGIRTSLRLGDSALIVGEVRSEEARALYEAMRVGALANTVAGTIHGDSPYGVYDRVVNDLNVPNTSFKATDLIIIANPVKTPDGLSSRRRVVQITEVRKKWSKDPLEEKGFVDLMKYNVEKDELEPTQELINGDSEIIKAIASNVRGWAGNWDAVYDNIILRGKIKQAVVELAEKTGNLKIMESEFNSMSNNAFHVICEEVIKEFGLPKSEEVFPRWQKWALDQIARM